MERNSKNSTTSYKFSQIFGYKGANEPVQEEDIISALKFDKSGRYIALGDKAGRIIVFRNEATN
jgi:serine/threonine-protein phosphatase 2A regulatory subunit B